MSIWLWQQWWYNILKEKAPHLVFVSVCAHLVKSSSGNPQDPYFVILADLWCKVFIAVVFMRCTSQSSLVNQQVWLLLWCLFLEVFCWCWCIVVSVCGSLDNSSFTSCILTLSKKRRVLYVICPCNAPIMITYLLIQSLHTGNRPLETVPT